MKFHRLISLIAITFTLTTYAEIPAGYYSTAEGKYGKELMSALNAKISSHKELSYSDLWDLFKTSDVRDNGTIWDMYSTKQWSISEKCGSYSVIGDCYNREHSFPKSWFNDATPMYTDAFHLYPTDGKVNGQRSNYPFGECANGSYVASNGNIKPLGRLGTSTFSGYSKTVFEPDDEYKGDFARSYFYMATAYMDKISSWSSDMLAGNNFPAFSSWAINLLLKWHRQDPVSDKELKRQEVVYAKQGNRNPYIDYPNLVEHIWGNMSTTQWSTSLSQAAEINKPIDGSTIDIGKTAAGYPISYEIEILTTSATEDVTIKTSGTAFTITPTTFTAEEANKGTTATITFSSSSIGAVSETLTIETGTTSSTVTITAEAISGLPAGPTTYITESSFEAVWRYIGDDRDNGTYSLDVCDQGGSLPGYPRDVKATDEKYLVTDLDQSSYYEYTIRSASLKSDAIGVTTADAIPILYFLFDGDLNFTTSPSTPSDYAEIYIYSENISGDITVSVGTPFEVSTNTNDWSTSVVLDEDEDRFFLRLNSITAGTFQTTLNAYTENYRADGVTISGTVSDAAGFLEDFEAEGQSTYSAHTYNGTATTWNFSDTGIWSGDPTYTGEQAARFGKTSASYIEMAKDISTGMGIVSFWAQRFNNDATATIVVEFSTNSGSTWETAGTVTVDATSFTQYSVAVNRTDAGRIRLRQTAGKRIMLDDLAITSYTTGLTEPNAERHQWNAYTSAPGSLCVSINRSESITIGIYAIDGSTVYTGSLNEGTHTFDTLAPGLYLVTTSDFTRTVVVR